MRRIAKPGGNLVLTTHGESQSAHAGPDGRAELAARGFHYVRSEAIDTHGLPASFQTAYHTQDYVRRQWSRHFEV